MAAVAAEMADGRRLVVGGCGMGVPAPRNKPGMRVRQYQDGCKQGIRGCYPVSSSPGSRPSLPVSALWRLRIALAWSARSDRMSPKATEPIIKRRGRLQW